MTPITYPIDHNLLETRTFTFTEEEKLAIQKVREILLNQKQPSNNPICSDKY